MLGREFKQAFRTTVTVVAAVCLFTACASSEVDTTGATEESPSDAALLLEESAPAATEVSDASTESTDASTFANLETTEQPAAEAPATSEAAPAPVAEEGAPYYNSIGGESLRRVAKTLYSDKSFIAQLLEKNPDLKGVKTLAADQRVYFDIDSVKPEPTYLTKDLLDRYPGQLADRLNAVSAEKGIQKTNVTLNKGETLQELSKRLYGTHRYWTEIFLVNHDKISNYDKVAPGLTLSVFDRPNKVASQEAVSEPKVVAARTEEVTPVEEVPPPVTEEVKAEAEVAPASLPIQPAPVAVDPIPETPVAQEVAPAPPAPVPAPVVETPPPAPTQPAAVTPLPVEQPAASTITSSNAATRPIIYGVLVVLIIAGGFYFTRTPKRPKVDMLDITAAEGGGRPKLTPKDTQKHHIG